jgi:hypothetical protein
MVSVLLPSSADKEAAMLDLSPVIMKNTICFVAPCDYEEYYLFRGAL